MAARLTIESAGPGTTVQDGGRVGHLRYGVTPAGPMDWVAFETANRALGNVPDAAAIEIGHGGTAVTADAPVTLAFAGGGFAWSRGDRHLPSAARVRLNPGETLRVRPGAWGAFTYCAVPGGLDLPTVMGSCATHVRSRLGGLDGRPLQAGDTLAVAGPDLNPDDAEIVATWLARDEAALRVVLGPQDDHFTAEALARLETESYTLTSQLDRMAYKLEGPLLAHARDFNIVSDGIALGAIQVAGDGRPMVLMADRQPTGGYPKIAHVCRADIGRLAQARPGEACRFAIVSAAGARQALFALEDRLAETPRCMTPLRIAPTAAALMRINLISGVASAT